MAERVLGMHHIGITVPDIEEGIAFFEKVFGAVTVFRTGAFDVDEDFMRGKLGAAPNSRIKDLVFLRCGNGTSVEFLSIAVKTSTPPRSVLRKLADHTSALKWKMCSRPPNS